MEEYFSPLISDKLIVLPEGRNKCEEVGGSDKRIMKIDKEEHLGEIIDKKYIAEKWPEKDPYKLLKDHLSKKADIIITVGDLVENNLEHFLSEGIVIADEIDQMQEPKDFTLLRFDVANGHLETSYDEPTLREVKEIVDKLENPYDPENDEFLAFQGFKEELETHLSFLLKEFPLNPRKWEERSLLRATDRAQTVEGKHIAAGLQTTKEEIEMRLNGKRDWELVNLKELLVNLPSLSDENHSETFNVNWNWNHLRYLDRQEKVILQRYLKTFEHVDDIQSKYVEKAEGREKGYYEVWALNKKSKLEEKMDEYDYALSTSATAKNRAGWEMITVNEDPNAKHKLVAFHDGENIEKVIEELLAKGYNILGVQTSDRRAKIAREKYGGKIIPHMDNLDQVVEEATHEEGNLYWDYYGSRTSRSVNELGVLDGVIISEDWIDKSDRRFPDTYEKKCAEKAYQHASRVLRTSNGEHRDRFVVISDEKLSQYFKEIAPWWKHKEFDTSDDMLEEIEEHTEKMPKKPKPPELKFKKVGSRTIKAYVPKDIDYDSLAEEAKMKYPFEDEPS